MKLHVSILIAAVLCIMVTGCSTLSNLSAIDTGTAVSSANFHYVKSITGEATSTYFLGFVGGNDAGKALADAKAKANLQKNQALTNVAVINTGKTILGVVVVVKTIVSADVIEFE